MMSFMDRPHVASVSSCSICMMRSSFSFACELAVIACPSASLKSNGSKRQPGGAADTPGSKASALSAEDTLGCFRIVGRSGALSSEDASAFKRFCTFRIVGRLTLRRWVPSRAASSDASMALN